MNEDDWFEKAMDDAVAAFQEARDEREEFRKLLYGRVDPRPRPGRIDPNAAKSAAAAFQAVENGAPALGTHPGYAGAGVKPTIGTRNGGEVRYKPVAVPASSQDLTPDQTVELILKSLRQSNNPRAAASTWLTKITAAITGYVASLDEGLDE